MSLNESSILDVSVFDPTPLATIDKQVPGTAQRIISVMRGDLEKALLDFPRLLAAGDLGILAKAAHKLRGSCGSVGAQELFNISKSLEFAGKANDVTLCTQTIPEVTQAIQRLQARLDVLFPISP